MAAVNASTKRIIWKFPQHAPTCAVVGDSQTKHLHTHFDPSSPDSPAFISQPGARIDDVGGLLDFVPRGVSLLVLHVDTNDIARTSAETAIQRYRTLLHHIKAERPDIGTIFVSLVLPRGPNERLHQPNLRRVGIINQEAHTFNCRLVDLCNEMAGVFYLDHAMQHFSPRMVLAADGLHPNFTGVSLLSWNLYNLLLRIRKPQIGDWRDHALPRVTVQPPPTSPDVPCMNSLHMDDTAYPTCPSATSQLQPVIPSFAQVVSNSPSASSREPAPSPVARPNVHQRLTVGSARTTVTPQKGDAASADSTWKPSETPCSVLSGAINKKPQKPRKAPQPAKPIARSNSAPPEQPQGPDQGLSATSASPSENLQTIEPKPGKSELNSRTSTSPQPSDPQPSARDCEILESSPENEKSPATPAVKRYDLRKHCGSARRICMN
ncbi:hypothetical protein HPB48_001225 [Haemaphysalis longicornis]|uniref:SGNH hydrolase-type esterase domain-containing protein n=1 Tax=Haemaphysalis longicornis TaxID=44386 RepID=A0A9J6F8X5_HAELO|nr:hypothetical protein HPB48_001225 [Haemaphysalis longicornis]